MPQPPYSRDLAAADFILFPRIETAFRGRHFDCIETVQVALTTFLSDIPDEAFEGAYHSCRIGGEKA